ncbi:MAG: helix-turn-helix transcriptional regulator [Bacilli bacterium]|nr:helix-turn-helix transcriptional regulator [Bacilli bacterium]MBQ2938198.1 helix-turn-helix transcriptional regulator [Clostridia bacterium]MBQ7031593.1 helix-turn-helix transcriptional regulator [Bacilli bacterium]
MLRQYDFDPNIRETICKNIKKYRKEKNVRLMDLAEAVDVCPDYLRRMESETGIKNISLITLYKISKVLDVRIDKFFEE